MNTTSYTDGVYDLRAIITDNAGNSYTTSVASTKVDNATLSSSLAAISTAVRGTISVSGDASSAHWGVGSWTPQFKPVGSGSWADACTPQSTPIGGSEYGCSVNTSTFMGGEYEARALAVDGAGKSATSSARIFLIDNTPPAGELDELPENVGGTYEVLGDASDSGSGVASWQLEVTPAGSETWGDACLVQTVPVAGPRYGCAVDVGLLSNGSYRLRALITDDAGNTYTTATVAMVVDNSPLSLSAAPAISGEVVDGETLTASTGTWGGGGPISYTFQWESCDTSGETCRAIPGASTDHYILGDGDLGTTLRVVVHAKNGVGEESATSAASGTVSYGTLGNISGPAISGAGVDGATLAVDPGSWRGARPLTFSYVWRKCNSGGAECATISGATSSSYKLVEADVGSTLRVIVTASDREGSASETSAATATIASGSTSGIRYLYDQAGRLSLVDDPDSGAASYSWDANGNLLSIERFANSTLAVLAFSPTRAPVSSTIEITGTGFNADPAEDTVKFDGTTATVTSATTTDITATVPAGAGTGAISVTVGGTSASSGGSFTPGSSGDALAPSVSGVSPDVAEVGETVTVSGSDLLGSPPSTSVTVNGLYSSPPGGSSSSLTFTVPPYATSGPVEVGTAHGLAQAGDLFVVPPEHTKEQVGPTARMEFAHATSATFASGKIGLFLFTGTKGHNASLHIGEWALSEAYAQVYVLSPEGAKVNGSQEDFYADGTDVLEQLPSTGTYTVVVIPRVGATGSLSLTPDDAPGVGTTILPSATGGEAELPLTLPGQQGRATFSGRPGERVLIEASTTESSFVGTMTLLGPGGISLGSASVGTAGLLDTTTLPSNGVYTIDVQGYASHTGTIALKAYLVPPDLTGTLTPTSEGASKSLTFTTPGQNAVLTFSGSAGEKVSLRGSSWSLSDSDPSFASTASTYLIAPSGAVLGESTREFTASGFYGVQVLPEAGTYEIVVNPEYATTGGLTLNARKIADIEGTLTPTTSGASDSLALEVPGQGAHLAFSGTSGEKVSLALSEWSLSTGPLVLSITSPSGGTVGGSSAVEHYNSNGFYEPVTLPSTGTYKINVGSPEGATGTVKLTAYDASDHTGTITINGSPVTTEIGTPGQNTLLTFSGSEGEAVKATASTVSIAASHLALISPSGSYLDDDAFGTSGVSFEKTLPSTGTYTLLVDPDGANTGHATIALTSEEEGEPHLRRGSHLPITPSGQTLQQPPTQTNPAAPSPHSPQGSGASATGPATGLPASRAAHPGKRVAHRKDRRSSRRARKASRHNARQARHHAARHKAGHASRKPHRKNVAVAGTASTGPAKAAGSTPPAPSGGGLPAAVLNAVPSAVSDYRSPYTSAWNPTVRNERDGDWITGRGPSPWATLPALRGLPAATGLTGQALVINGTPLAGVTLTLKGTTVKTRTDSTGRFVLAGLPAGHQILTINGATADGHGYRYGQFSVGVDLTAGQTTALGYTIWMTPLERAGNTTINYPLRQPTVLRNPRIPGLEVRLPAGTVVRSGNGSAVRQLNVTAIPVDRPPFPLPFGDIPTYFTVQPGGAYLNKGAQIVYPNWGHLPPGQRVDFWNYDPTDKGWYIYGKGSVSANGRQVIPDPDVRVWEFTGAMISSTGEPSHKRPRNGAEKNDGDPVDLATGLFVYHHTDLVLPDSMMPVELTRTYRQADGNSYSFGVGTQSLFDIHLWSDENYRTAELVLPNGATIEYRRTSPGTGYTEAVYAAHETPGEWDGSVLSWNGHGWSLRRRDGTIFFFGIYAGLQGIEDRNGNRITLIREGGPTGPIKQIRTPHGRWIDLTYDSYNRITQATDNSGQTVHYEYNGEGDLIKVTDPKGNATHYAYDATHEMTSVTDARGHTLISNTYSEFGDVTGQTVMGRGTYTFTYTAPTGYGLIVEPVSTIVHGPEGERRVYFYENTLWPTCESSAAHSVCYTRNSDGQVTSTYSHGNRAYYEYDSLGNVTSITEVPSEGPRAKTTLTYNEAFSRPASITNPLGQTTTFSYDANGNLTQATDPMGLQSTMSYDPDGQLTSATDPQGNTTHYTYAQGDLVSETDPLGNETQVSYDGAGRPVGFRNAEGGLTQLAYDEDNNLTSSIDPAGDTTSYTYDEDSNLTGITDPRGHTQHGVYSSQDQLTSWTDALEKTTSYAYNSNGELESATDPKGQKTSYSYDEDGRLSTVGFGATGGGSPTSTISYGYGTEDELTSVDDSRAGNYTLSYDPKHRLTGVSGPNGSIGYTYNTASEREGMTLGGETAASYTYNADGQLTAVETPHGNVAMHYDSDGRPAKVELPNSDTETYTYNQDSQLAGVDYENPEGGQVGNLQYARNPLGQISTISGSMARTNLPATVSENTYNADNELTSSEGHTLTYDNDGNLTGDGTSTYAYNDRNQLTEVTQGANTWDYAYDPFGRRIEQTHGSTHTAYRYDGPNITTELTGGTITAKMLNGLGIDEHFARTTSSETSSYLTDQQNSTLALTNEAGTPTTEYTYDPFGAATHTGASTSNPYQYTGLQTDEDGLQNNRARYYNPTTTRFTSQDPAGIEGSGTNLYQYALSDPIDYTDPTGYTSILRAGAEFVVGFGDAVSGGLTRDVREATGIGNPEGSSGAYQLGGAVGLGVSFVVPGDEEAGLADEAAQVWPDSPEGMDELLNVDGTRVPDGPTTPGRSKVTWKPNENTNITYEQHPYHPGAPPEHTGPHWHLETPAGSHERYLPGDPLP